MSPWIKRPGWLDECGVSSDAVRTRCFHGPGELRWRIRRERWERTRAADAQVEAPIHVRGRGVGSQAVHTCDAVRPRT
eukprot:2509733-Prymnesium_polylepis.1